MHKKENAQLHKNVELSASEHGANTTTGFVLAPLSSQQHITMTSLELVDFINEGRKARAEAVGAQFPSPGFAKLGHKDFLAKVTQVLGLDTSEKFSADLPDSYGRSRRGYRFSKREACLMAMSYSYELQAKVFDHMTALEQAHAQTPALPNFDDPVAAARAWADAKEGEQKAIAELALAGPKVAFVDRYVAATSGEKGFREVCKLLEANELEFSEFLFVSNVMYRLAGKMTPRAEHMTAGRFKVKTGTAPRNEHTYVQVKFTPKGVAWIAGLWGQHKAKQAEMWGV